MEEVVAGLSAAQLGLGHRVEVVTLSRAITDGSALPEGAWGGVPYRRVERLGPRAWPWARGLVERVRGADLVHVHGVDGLLDLLLATRRWHGARVGVSTHGAYLHTGRWRAAKQLWLRSGTRLALRAADAVWFDSELDRSALRPAGAEGEVIPNGVRIEPFLALPRRPEPGRWLVHGRVDVHKGTDDLIEVVAALGDRGPRRVVVAGAEATPGLIRSLETLARRRGVGETFRFLGPVSEQALLDQLQRAERAVYPSRYEGFGVAVVEAMAAGIAPIVSDIPAHRELVTLPAEGAVVDLRDVPGAVARLAALPVGGSEAPRLRAARFGWEQVVERWEQAYRAALGAVLR